MVSKIVSVDGTFTRPSDTTAYAAGDLMANSTTAASVAAMTFDTGGPMVIRRGRLLKSDDDLTAASFRLHLFSADPCSTAPAGGDNAALSLNVAIATYIGSMDFDMTAAPDIFNTAGNLAVGVPLVGGEILVPKQVDRLYGLLEARAAYTPASAEVFTVELDFLWI